MHKYPAWTSGISGVISRWQYVARLPLLNVVPENGGSGEDVMLPKLSATDNGGFKEDPVLIKTSKKCGGAYYV